MLNIGGYDILKFTIYPGKIAQPFFPYYLQVVTIAYHETRIKDLSDATNDQAYAIGICYDNEVRGMIIENRQNNYFIPNQIANDGFYTNAGLFCKTSNRLKMQITNKYTDYPQELKDNIFKELLPEILKEWYKMILKNDSNDINYAIVPYLPLKKLISRLKYKKSNTK